MRHKDIARAIAGAYDVSGPLIRFYRADGTQAVNTGEAQYMSRFNPLTGRLRVLLYPHHETIGLFYLGPAGPSRTTN